MSSHSNSFNKFIRQELRTFHLFVSRWRNCFCWNFVESFRANKFIALTLHRCDFFKSKTLQTREVE